MYIVRMVCTLLPFVFCGKLIVLKKEKKAFFVLVLANTSHSIFAKFAHVLNVHIGYTRFFSVK